ncbi:hypothetical protein EV193_104559 [Herbihabitans rhizosphaerae]|uniref:Uncharacterized protein n=1 Tax=Herbihabitans rhizosphaerae TaxID=1872711 RepID=A0A4Q7KV00_9PSEU|nr:hypothetical protein [Herbihabitans rhizosphaerae]RZS39342.1 hypothetical protein EV193_104559 [Herbihabitans rhizosphaerae]
MSEGLSFEVPEGFVRLPTAQSGEAADRVAEEFAALLGLDGVDEGTVSVAQMLALYGEAIGDAGFDYAAMGLFRSPSEPRRPVSALLMCTRIPVPRDAQGQIESQLGELESLKDGTEAERVQILAGTALITTSEETQTVPIEAAEPVVLRGRRITCWIPSPTRSTVGLISVFSHSWPDRDHVRDMAMSIFDTVEWGAGDDTTP